jgi:hypothetical protein
MTMAPGRFSPLKFGLAQWLVAVAVGMTGPAGKTTEGNPIPIAEDVRWLRDSVA